MQCIALQEDPFTFTFKNHNKPVTRDNENGQIITSIIQQLQMSMAYNKQAIREKRKRQSEIWNLSFTNIHQVNKEICELHKIYDYTDDIILNKDYKCQHRFFQIRKFINHTSESSYLATDIEIFEFDNQMVASGCIHHKVGETNHRREVRFIFDCDINFITEKEIPNTFKLCSKNPIDILKKFSNHSSYEFHNSFMVFFEGSEDYLVLPPKEFNSHLYFTDSADSIDEICFHPRPVPLMHRIHPDILPYTMENIRLTDYIYHELDYFYKPSFMSADVSIYTQKIKERVSDKVTITKYKSNISLNIEAHKITTITEEKVNIQYYENDNLVETVSIYYDESKNKVYREWTVIVDNTTLGLGKIFTTFKSFIKKISFGNSQLDSLSVNQQNNNGHNSYDLTIGPTGKVLVANGKVNPTETYGFKAVIGPNGEKLLAVLELPSKKLNGVTPKVASNIYGAGKLRTNIAKVLEFYEVDILVQDNDCAGLESESELEFDEIAHFTLIKSNVKSGYSFVHQDGEGFEYHKNTTIIDNDFEDKLDMVCVAGIHYCPSAKSALEFHAFGKKIGSVEICRMNHGDEDGDDDSADEWSYLLKKKNQ